MQTVTLARGPQKFSLGRASTKKAPFIEKKAPHKEKKVAKMPPHREKDPS